MNYKRARKCHKGILKLYLIMLMIMSDIFLKCPIFETFRRKRAHTSIWCGVQCPLFGEPCTPPLQSVPLPSLAVPGLVAHLPRHSGRHLHGEDVRCRICAKGTTRLWVRELLPVLPPVYRTLRGPGGTCPAWEASGTLSWARGGRSGLAPGCTSGCRLCYRRACWRRGRPAAAPAGNLGVAPGEQESVMIEYCGNVGFSHLLAVLLGDLVTDLPGHGHADRFGHLLAGLLGHLIGHILARLNRHLMAVLSLLPVAVASALATSVGS